MRIAVHDVLVAGARRDEDDRYSLRRRAGAQPLQHFDAAHADHHEIEQNDVRRTRIDFPQRRAAVRGGAQMMALRFKHDAQNDATIRDMVDDQYSRALVAGSLCTVRFG